MLQKAFAVRIVLMTVTDRVVELREIIILDNDWNKAKRVQDFLQPAANVSND